MQKLLKTCLLFAALHVNAQNQADRDASFNVSGLGTTVFGIGNQYSQVTPLPGGKVLVTGSFYSAATTSPQYSGLFRLNNDGSFDNTFNVGGVGTFGAVAATAILPDGKILIGGGFVSYNGTSLNGIARLHPNGSLDTTFNAGTGFSSILPPPWVFDMAIQPDGKIIVVGGFTRFNGTAIAGVCRLLPNGSLDTTFNPGAGPNNIVQAVALQADGKIVVGGVFARFDGVNKSQLARLLPNGSLDTAFTNGATGDVRRVIVQPDGKILISGWRFNRLETNGSLDPSFPTALGTGNTYSGLALQPDGKIIVSGAFTSFLGQPRQRIVRVLPNGALDPTFDASSGFATNPNHLALQPDGKIVVYGGLEYQGASNMVTRILGQPTGISVAETQPDAPKLVVYPNPASNYLTIAFDPQMGAATGAFVGLYNLEGKKLLEQPLNDRTTTVYVGHLPAGVYLLQYVHGQHQLTRRVTIY